MTRIADPQINFADIEFLTQGVDLDPILKRISDFLDDQPRIAERVRQDLQWGLKRPATGRTAMTPTQVLRSLVLMRVKNWDYRELRERIADGYTLRRFTGFNSRRVPKHDAFNRAFNFGRKPLKPSMTWSLKPLSIWGWRTARDCALIRRWLKPISIIQPIILCSGMWCE